MSLHARAFAPLCLILSIVLSRPVTAQFIYVANAGEDTVSKIDVTTNQEVARYRTWFGPTGSSVAPPHLGNPWFGPAPSRIAVDPAGNVFVLNRFFTPVCGLLHLPVLVKILPTGGGTTSTGSVALPMLDTNGNCQLDSGDTKDARIAWAVDVGTPGSDEGALGRALCIGLDGNLWVGIYKTMRYYKVSSATGATLAGPISTPGHTPYGCSVDASGTLWSASETNTVAQIDTNTNTLTKVWDHSAAGSDHVNHGENYSLTLLGGCGVAKKTLVYLSERFLGLTYIALDPSAATPFSNPSGVPLFQSYSIAATQDGHLVSASLAGTGGSIIKYPPNGTPVWATPLQPAAGFQEVRGIIVDAHDDIWTVNRVDNSVSKFSGASGLPLLSAPLKIGDSPYTYGNALPPNCPCALINDKAIRCEGENGGIGTYSYSFTFTNNSPFATPATCMAISSTDVTALTPPSPIVFPPISPGGQATVAGTFTETNPQPGSPVCLNLQLQGGCGGTPGWCCPSQQVCFHLPECSNCAQALGQFTCVNGTWYLVLTVTNNGPAATSTVEVVSDTPGVTVTPAITALSLAPHASGTVQIAVNGAAPGQTINLTVNLHGPTDPKTGAYAWCCSASVQVIYPKRRCLHIEGEVYDDKNREGRFDEGDEGIAGVTVVLEGAPEGPRTATTDKAGNYQFNDVPEGTYRLTVRNPGGLWKPTAPQSGSYTVIVGGPPSGSYDFGFVRQP